MLRMDVKPIVVKDGAVHIPLEYLDNASEFELVVDDGVVVVRPKPAAYEINGSNGVQILHDQNDVELDEDDEFDDDE